MTKHAVELADVDRFLRDRYETVDNVTQLKGGVWSTAFGFRVGKQSLVVRFGDHIEDYEKDRMAGTWARPLLPTPAVLDVGAAFDGAFAVSERVEGDQLDAVSPDRMPLAIESLIETLRVLEDIALPGSGYGIWRAPTGDAPHQTWQDFLTSVPHRDAARIHGWRDRLASATDARKVFDRAQRLLEHLVHRCPDRRSVVHGDLLAGNVLVTTDNRISAVLDWGNALAGDPLYDLAWLMFWAPWHPGIDHDRLRQSAESRPDNVDLNERLLCYQLHIALDGMQYQAFAGLDDNLRSTARHASWLLHGT
jgi:hygromycin-B 4-O-kinase